jgi:hypothetical protein
MRKIAAFSSGSSKPVEPTVDAGRGVPEQEPEQES